MKTQGKRGDIFWATLGTGAGSEQSGLRPVLVIQNDIGNRHSPTVIIAAITDGKKKHLPTHVQISKGQGLPKDSIVMLEQIRTIDKQRLSDQIGSLNEYDMYDVGVAMQVSLGLMEVEHEHSSIR